ncbi:MAG TPA: hypothetical protein EYH43_04960 [Persephonella sp.]|nr:hypothetical protein [Hydrogenothermaceae bacterium]HIQ25314.1 hypothetical protein [Persephonella sp.]
MDIFDKCAKVVTCILIAISLSGCALSKNDSEIIKEIYAAKPKNETKKNKSSFSKTRKLQNISPPPSPFSILSEMETIAPLKTERITIHAINSPLKELLYSIANDLGLNLIVSPEVNINKNITLNLDNVLAKDALNIIENIAEINFQLKGSILFVKSIITKTFNISYIQALSGYNVSLGGNVLGNVNLAGNVGGGGNLGGGLLTGNFSLNYEKIIQEGDFYTQLERNIRHLLSRNGVYTLNRSTGTLVVTDRISNVRKIERFLNNLKKELRKEVLIEAKIIEITLNKEYSYGIDWNKILDILPDGSISLTQNLAPNAYVGQILVSSLDFDAIIRAISTAGKIETLSNPRIRVINGQSALISTGTVIPYWEKQINNTILSNNVGGNLQQISYVRTSVLNGILLGVSAYINNDNTITINVVPVSTRIKGEKQLIDNNQIVAQAPIIELKEAGTIIRVKDGNTIIIGGLMSKDKQINEIKVPLLGDIPYLGVLFKRKTISYEKKELIIFLKPQIIRGIE